MTVGLQIILIAAAIMVGIGLVAIAAWIFYTALLNRREHRLAIRKGLYRDLVSGLALRERTLLEPTLRQFETLSDVEALEAVLEEQARSATERPAWLLDAYDRLGLVDKYIERLRHAKRWRDRAFAAELLGRVGNAKAVPALLETVQATRTEDADVREIALRALARIADPRAVPPLVDALQGAEAWLAPRLADILARHGDAVVEPMMGFLDAGGRHPARPWAASVLGEVRAQRAFPVLVRALGDLDDEVRSKAATALGRLADPRAVPYLLENLLSDPAPFVRTRIAAALGQFDDPEVIDRLVRALGDSAWWVRMRSVEALEQIGLAAEGPLLVALDDPDAEIRLRAAAALERLGVPQRLVAMIAAGDRVDESTAALGKFAAAGARELLAEQLQHPSPAVRIAVVTAIRRAGRRDLAGELLISAADETDAAVRAAALEALAALEVHDAVPVAVDHLSDPDERVRSEALGLLGRLGSPDMIAAVEARSGDPEPAVRAAAARALGAGVGAGADAIPVLRGLLHDPAPEVREQSARAVAQLELRTLAPAVRDLLDDPAAPVRRAAAEALGRVDDRSGAPALLAALAHAPEDLHQSLAEAIGRLDPLLAPELANQLAASGDVAGKLGLINALAENSSDASAPTITRMVEDPSPAVRSAAIQALARIDDQDAAARARRALADPDAGVRAAAVDTLVRLQDAASEPDLRERLAADPSPLVRERAALAVGLFAEPGGAPALLDACRTDQPAAVRAAAVLALGAYHDESIVARLLELSDETTVRRVLQQRLRDDPEFRLLGERLQQSHHTELRALAAQNRDAMELSLAEGTRSALDIAERMRLVSALRAFQGERSRSALLHVVRSDPSSDVRAAALQAVADMVPPDTLLRALQRALGDPSPGVRRVAVALFTRLPAEEALPELVSALRSDEDAAVLQAVAAQAQGAFENFARLAGSIDRESSDAITLTRLAQFVHHAGLAELIAPLASSSAPAVREAVAELWMARPDLADSAALARLVRDPVTAVRRAAAGAAAAAGQPDAILPLAEDPDPVVRRDLALLLHGTLNIPLPSSLRQDPDESVRAAAAVSSLLRGEATRLPAGVSREAAAAAVSDLARTEDLRGVARTAPDPVHRLAAALALALVGDPVAHQVAAHDPLPSVRDQVAAMLRGERA